MTLDLAILQLSENLASYASVRQGVVAQNISNADTPGYRARDLLPFAQAYASMAHDRTGPAPGARTRLGHFELSAGTAPQFENMIMTPPGATSPNGNSVSLEDQMMRGVELKLQHDMALGIYQKSLKILRAGLGRIQ